MAARRKVERTRRTHLVTVRMQPSHVELIKRAADQAGITMSAWLTERALVAARAELGVS